MAISSEQPGAAALTSGGETLLHSHPGGGGANVKSGVITAVVDAATGSVVFAAAFAATPRVSLSLYHGSNAAIDIPIVTAVSSTGFSYRLHKGHTGSAHTWDLHWLATDAGP